jgi:RimJ/RimL family protein N-acetyltransferase
MTTFDLADLKAGRGSLPLVREGIQQGDLRAANAQDATALSDWRDANRRWFLTEFPPDAGATRAWLEAIRDAPDRLLMMIRANDQSVGVVGLRGIDLGLREAELDNVLRGRPTPGRHGFMSLAVRTLAAWAADELSIRRLYLHVLRDNPACSFYRQLGFVVSGVAVGLAFEGTDRHGSWRPTTNEPERYLLRMELAIDAAKLRSLMDGSSQR